MVSAFVPGIAVKPLNELNEIIRMYGRKWTITANNSSGQLIDGDRFTRKVVLE